MNRPNLIVAIGVIAVLSTLCYFLIFESEHESGWGGKVQSGIQQISLLDTSINEISLKNRYGMERNYDRLAMLPRKFYAELDDLADLLSADPHSEQASQKVETLRNEFANKEDILENFKAHNSVLRNSLAYAPAAGNQLIEIAAMSAESTDDEKRLVAIVSLIPAYALTGSATDAEAIKVNLAQLGELENRLPDFAAVAVIEFVNHVNTLLTEKLTTDRYLAALLSNPIRASMLDLQHEFNKVVEIQTRSAAKERAAIFAMLIMLFLGFLFLTFRLMRVSNLIPELLEKGRESERLARKLELESVESAGAVRTSDAVSDFAQDLHSTLERVRANMLTVARSTKAVDKILSKVEELSNAVSTPAPDRVEIGRLLRELIQSYRKERPDKHLDGILELAERSRSFVDDASDTLTGIIGTQDASTQPKLLGST